MPGYIDKEAKVLVKMKGLDVGPNPRIFEVHELLIEKGIRVWLTPSPEGKELDIV